MSISGILSGNSNPYQLNTTNLLQQELQQLGQALQSGNLSTAQSDFATLQQAFAQPATTTGPSSTTSTSNPVAQAVTQLGSDLQSGNLSAAQKDYATVQQDLKGLADTQLSSRIHNHHRVGHAGGGESSSQNSLLQDLNQLGQSLSSTSLSSAQQAYSTLQQQLQQFALGSEDASELSNLPVSLDA